MVDEPRRFRFSVLGRYRTQTYSNEPHVTVNMQAGPGNHLVYCGTLTMTEAEWATFIGALRGCLPDGVEVEDRSLRR